MVTLYVHPPACLPTCLPAHLSAAWWVADPPMLWPRVLLVATFRQASSRKIGQVRAKQLPVGEPCHSCHACSSVKPSKGFPCPDKPGRSWTGWLQCHNLAQHRITASPHGHKRPCVTQACAILLRLSVTVPLLQLHVAIAADEWQPRAGERFDQFHLQTPRGNALAATMTLPWRGHPLPR